MKRTKYGIVILTVNLLTYAAVDLHAQKKAFALTPVEDSIRKTLNIPSGANRVIILSHAAHMDWDWLNSFPYNSDMTGKPSNCNPCNSYVAPCSYFSQANTQPANNILSQATTQLLNTPAYYYSVCEMGFLRAFANKNPSLFNSMKKTNRLRIVGGGMTSPDNLLPNGETFLRNFLVAKQWLTKAQVPWSQQVWIPDDFGHDPQLPISLQALDAMGVGFARIPGACDGGPQLFSTPQSTLLNTTNGGVDFKWAASDSSETIAHWLQDHYGQGNDIDGADYVFNSVKDNLACNNVFYASSPITHIQSYINTNGPVSPTPYIYVDVSGDFMVPYQQLVSDANTWNSSPQGYKATGVYAVVATFDQYVRLVNCYPRNLKLRSYNPLTSGTAYQPFQPNPYWMGYYASRPALKTLHHTASRTLLAAETYQVIANTLVPPTASEKQTQINNLLAAWDTLAASTHHDYITGTAVDDVYNYEQIPLLNKALQLGYGLKSQFMTMVASNLPAIPSSVVVFNPLGFANKGIISYQPSTGPAILLNVTAPALGYNLNNIATAQKGDGSLRGGRDATGYYLANSIVAASFDPANADLQYVYDYIGKKQVLAGKGNEIVVFQDQGDIYRFGYEDTYPSGKFTNVALSWTVEKILLDTVSVLQKSITVIKSASIGGKSTQFTITYSLRQGEPFLRISTTGTLPQNYTAMVKFPLAGTIDNIIAGTPYHWNSMQPMAYGTNSGFNATVWATHDFVIPRSSGNNLAAIYHSSTPAWASQGNNLYGVILRNTPNTGYGACGSDPGTHTQAYALRVPSGLGLPNTGQPLKEARQYNTPMEAMALPATGGGKLPASYSVASTSGDAFITAAKWSYDNPNALILRVYQASNKSTNSTLNISSGFAKCSAVSALEVPIINATIRPNIIKSGTQYSLRLPRALATFRME